ncbi:MAG: hypothetical protein SGI92_30600 [Bryobacteraceae bacterium]|nr:hypothetical protein [Bryobacteraceae bacterium]
MLIFDNIKVENSMGLDLRVNGKFNPLVPSIVYNFKVKGVGAICRVEVNNTMHGGARTHKHSLQNEEDPRRNLPATVARPDLEGKSPREVWTILCRQANIVHVGEFVDP